MVLPYIRPVINAKEDSSMYLLTNGRVITRDEGGKSYYEKGAVAYEDTKIV